MLETSPSITTSQDPIPARAGVGLKAQHYRDVLEKEPDLGFFEVHAENYMGDGGLPHHFLSEIRKDYALSVHGVGMSLGSAGGLCKDHVQRFKHLVERYEPTLISEHISWSAFDGVYYNDLMPVPYTEEALSVFCENIDHLQNVLGRKILVENPSAYLAYESSIYDESTFILEILKRTGCGLLLDVNNVYVSASNQNFDAQAYLDSIPTDVIGEVHLAGHTVTTVNNAEVRIDDHGSPVIDPVWSLFERLMARAADVPVLIEWDANLPDFDTLHAEAKKADAHRGSAHVEDHHVLAS